MSEYFGVPTSLLGSAQRAYVPQHFIGQSTATLGLSWLGKQVAKGVGNVVKNVTSGGTFDVGDRIEIESNEEYRQRTGRWPRRRRRRLLTAQDKSDIAFIVGQLGTGQAGKAALSALLTKRGC